MDLHRVGIVVGLILVLATLLSAGPTVIPLPADLQGELDGVPYRIRVPENWHGTLLVYAHGYGEGATPPSLAPLNADVELLLAKGFALAASRFAGSGWTVKEGMQNTVALTSAFNGMVGHPQRTIIWGRSMGGLMTLGLIEKFPGHYDGALALCAPASGTPRRFDQGLDIALAYAVAFGWNPEWGTPGDIRNDLNFMSDIGPTLQTQLGPEQYGRWEFVRLVNRMPIDSYYAPLAFRVTSLLFATAVRAELEGRAGGPVAENVGRIYALTDAEKSYLAGLGVNADALLLEMNAMATFISDHNARNYAEHYVNPSGRITRPVLTLHTEGDSLATPNNESAYRATVDQQGNGNLLMQQFTKGISHCSFTSAQDIAGIEALMYWLDTGQRPDVSVFFTPELGFDSGFVPEPWPW